MRKSKSAYIAVVILLGLAGVAVMSVTMGSGRQAGPEFISDFRAASILYEKGKYAEANRVLAEWNRRNPGRKIKTVKMD